MLNKEDPIIKVIDELQSTEATWYRWMFSRAIW